jgi:OMF family outer membrane factor
VWSKLGHYMLKLTGILAPFFSLLTMATMQGDRAIAAILPQSTDQLCTKIDFSALEQDLVPESAESPTVLPPRPPLERPQQSEAVTIQQMLPLSLPEAIRLAFERNPDLQVSKLQVQRSCAQLKQAKAANWPTLQVSGSISRIDDGRLSPENRVYDTDIGSQVQQQTASTLEQQQAIAQQEFQQQLQQLQDRFQQTATQVQRDTFQQQLQQLQQRADSNTALGTTIDITPLTPGSVALPLSGGSGVSGTGGYFNGSLSLSYPLFTGGRRDASIQLARRQVETSALGVQLQLQQLREAVTTNYYDLQQTQALITVAESAVKNAQENLRIIRVGEQAGIRTRFEVLQAEVALADTLQNQTQAKALYQIARRQLAQQLSLPDAVDVTLPDALQATKAGLWPLSLEETIILALNNRIELNQILLQRQSTQLQKRIVASQRKPQLQGIASLNLADDLEDRFLGAYGYAVGVQMSLDVFDGGDVRSQLNQLDKTIAILDQQFNQRKEAIRFEVEQAYSTLQANATNINTASQALTQAQEGLRLAQLRLQAGVGTTLEVTRAQADLTQAQSNLIGALLDYNRALATLERVTGYTPVKK